MPSPPAAEKTPKASPLLPCSQPQDHVTAPDATMLRPQSKRRFHAALAVLVLGLFGLARTWNCDHDHGLAEPDARVPLDVHIM